MRTTTLIACGVALALGAGAPATTSVDAALRARAASTLRATDTAHMRRVRCACDEILEEGQARGSLPGALRAFVTIGAPIVFRFTITVRGVGSLSGQGSGRPKGNPAEPSFSGTMTVTRGTGRYRYAHGKGGFYGTINRATYAAVVQTTATLSY
jgi:hypothetical protein